MTRNIHSPSLKDRLVAPMLSRWQACSGTVQNGGNAGEEEFLCIGICEVFFCYERSVCIPALEHNCPQISQQRNATSLDRAPGLDDVLLLPLPVRSPDLTPCDFYLWGYVIDKVYVPPMPTTLQTLQERIIAALTDIDVNMLLNIWTELDYRWDVCRVSKDARIEHLWYAPETW
ncbi:hypothetical protein AVEN_140668-1 [Araneus ventricosus]|uniref:Uncharacterized protein n=1 Tax=Araneus ventricosus TaxID=182803 RepID=A0A4Y2C3Z8_ARAVE|nr:hypothetical protein AVEN_140668-1 [Araneus ventricosus]